MDFEQLEDIVDVPLSPRRPSTEETLDTIKRFQHRCRSSVRISTGQIMEDDVLEQRRNAELEKPLP